MSKFVRYIEECLFNRDLCDKKNEPCEAIKYICQSENGHFDENKAISLVDHCQYRLPSIQPYKLN
jgi:hypothetical protein